MNKEELSYLNLLSDIIKYGEKRSDRTGVGTLSLFGESLKFSLKDNTIPLLTTKKMYFKGIVEELLFFLRGDTNTKILEEKGINIWKGNTSREFLDKRGLTHLPEGDLGKGYSWQWRKFGATETSPGVDQIKNVLESLKNDPHGRRHLVSAWNPLQEPETSLVPCHYSYQFYVSNKNELSCLWNQRSVDSFLGLGFNIASYALLTHIFAKTLNYTPGNLIFNGGDTHLYLNHLDAASEQISRTPYDFPKLKINKELNNLTDIESLCFEDFELIDYKYHNKISAPMAI